MAFQIKDFASITASMINWMKSTQQKITDFNIGSIVRTMLEAIAAEIDELYQQFFIGLKEAIPVATYNTFDFAKRAATPASGIVRVTITSSGSNTLIAAGTTLSIVGSSVTYSVNQDTTILAGNTYADVLVTATTAGSAGNIAAGQSFTMAPQSPGFVSASNSAAFISGADEESDDDRKLRFNAYIQSLNRGTVAAIIYGMKTTYLTDAQGNPIERVVAASVVEPYETDNTQPVALVNCYIHNGVGSTSSSLVNKTKSVLYGYYDSNGNAVPGWKAAGVHFEVFAATEQAVTITGVLTALAGYDKPTLVLAAQAALSAYVTGLDIGVTAIKSEMIALVMNIEGVYNFTLSSPAGDTTANQQTKLMPGTITIT
jgi:uncharacterized phage protein gp47/JayE